MDTTEFGFSINRDIELTGENIKVRARSEITTIYKELETKSIGEFLESKMVTFNLIKSSWICKECADTVNILCDHISFDPRLIRLYSLETKGFECLITEAFIELPFENKN